MPPIFKKELFAATILQPNILSWKFGTMVQLKIFSLNNNYSVAIIVQLKDFNCKCGATTIATSVQLINTIVV
jgi:hypothetical protein